MAMNPGGRLWRVDLAAVLVAAAIVGLFVTTMAVEQILPEVGADPQRGLTKGTAAVPDCTKGRVALAFDGGPDPDVTPALLDTLRDERIVATFFVAVDRAAQQVPLVQRMATSGHQVELYLPAPPPGAATDPARRDTLVKGRQLFGLNGIRLPRLVHPEGGVVDVDLTRAAAESGLDVAADPGALDIGDRDLASPRTIERRIVDGVAAHKVFIAHDAGVAGLNTTAALATTVNEVHDRGYCFARLDDVKDGSGVIVVSGGEAKP
jgi:peptidoglycan/xylan/chitin deacetylase (PgdA/CDA1 family)